MFHLLFDLVIFFKKLDREETFLIFCNIIKQFFFYGPDHTLNLWVELMNSCRSILLACCRYCFFRSFLDTGSL